MTTTAELTDISAAIHDLYFSVERLEHVPGRAELRVPIYSGRLKKWWFIETGRPPEEPPPPPVATLIVRNVSHVSLEDEADIGWYDVNRLEYDSEAAELRIISNVPCEVVVKCCGLDIKLLRA